MPKIVDRDRVRRDIARAANRTIMRAGLDGATMKQIAREAGFSAGAPLHYFDSREDIVDHAFEVAANDLYEIASEKAARAAPGLARLRAVIATFMPFREPRSDSIMTFLRYVMVSVSDERMESLQISADRQFRALIARILREAIDAGEIARETDVTRETDVILAASDGLAIRVLSGLDGASRARARRVMETLIARLPGYARRGSRAP